MQWGDGLEVKPGNLSAAARRLRQANQQLEGQIEALQNLDMGPWRGETQRNQRAAQRAAISDMQSISRRLEPTASALDWASDAFGQIQSAQQNLLQRAHSWQFDITYQGAVRNASSSLLDALNPLRQFAAVQIQLSVGTLIIRLNFTDVTLAARLGGAELLNSLKDMLSDGKDALFNFGEAVADKALSGIEWLGGKIKDGLGWAGDKIKEGWEGLKGLGENFLDRLGHAGKALGRFGEELSKAPQWWKDLVNDHKIPQLSEVLGHGLYLAGSLAGVPANFIADKDVHLFDDGSPYHARRDEIVYDKLDTDPVGGAPGIFDRAADRYDSHDQNDPTDRAKIQVAPVIGPDNKVRYVVTIPGTTEGIGSLDGWSGSPAGTDWAANLKLVGTGTSSATESIRHSIDLAIQEDMAKRGIDSGQRPQVLLSGHSQGGIIASALAADPGFRQDYQVSGVLSGGSPVETMPVPREIPVYNYQNQYDPIPRLDLGGFVGGDNGNMHDVVFPDDGDRSVTHTHGQNTYSEKIHELNYPSGNDKNVLTDKNVQQQAQMNREFYQYFNGRYDGSYEIPYGRETD